MAHSHVLNRSSKQPTVLGKGVTYTDLGPRSTTEHLCSIIYRTPSLHCRTHKLDYRTLKLGYRTPSLDHRTRYCPPRSQSCSTANIPALFRIV